ncbi:MAG: ribosome assembly factor SBDS [Euryarchaeota archaeon]|nr:ribosome assembly factor SBDS [Euryarchaeota archaeon]
MVTMDDAVIARLDTHGERYEVLVDADLAMEFKRGKDVELSKLLAVETVFKDSKKGEKASEEMMQKRFGTVDPMEVAKAIVKKGDIQFTTEQRRRAMEEKKKRIIATIARNAINPQTDTPHPPARIEAALEEAKFHVDLTKSVDEQVKLALKLLRPIIPIKFEEKRIAVKIPPEHAPRCMAAVREFGDIRKEEWQKDGSWVFVMDLPAGIVDDFFDKLNSITKGEVETKIL